MDTKLSLAPKSGPAKQYDAIQLRFYLLELIQEINYAYFGRAAEGAAAIDAIEPLSLVREALHGQDNDSHIPLKPLLSFSDVWQPLELPQVEDEWALALSELQKSPRIHLSHCGTYIPSGTVMDVFERLSVHWSCRLPAESLKAGQWRYVERALEKMAAEVYLSGRGVSVVPQSTLDIASRCLPRGEDTQVKSEDHLDELPSSQPRSSQTLPTPSATPSSSRAASEAVDSAKNDEEQEDTRQEDATVARLRMYLPSIKFTPPPKNGPRIISLWPEERGSDPSEYQYQRFRKGPDQRTGAAQREREKKEERRRRKADRKAQLGMKMEAGGEFSSQPLLPTIVRSSPPPQDVGSSSQGIGFGFGSQSQSQGFGFSQTMSQPVAGEFGGLVVMGRMIEF
ncbi:hypothetical protein M406DRAFT_68509 [Cryphonectria parasitica EP155]|uniref:RRN6 K-rich C-terminal domain-containing protein n=1 Tax=Cryphonectria parasitica (strain ATCC 38755 / EP155) TaxID=660469 RepID=A0A9P4Y4D0_CRYP1|nr:uncharacterized protein M406DRAFT_68509 [Cryphonectria parasitica EP155]KAF3766137.1 hypothetical protein M406DRAFT_68509 [Cryphonectria parasitica EP155]